MTELLAGLTPTSVRSVTGSLGLLVTAVLIGLLVEHEVVSAVAPGRRPGHRRAVEVAIVALLIAFAAVVIVRFKWLSL